MGFFDFFGKLRVGHEAEGITAKKVKRGVNRFSYFCAILVLSLFIFLGFSFVRINNIMLFIFLVLGFLLSAVTKRVVYFVGMKRARERHFDMMDDLVFVRWGIGRKVAFSLLSVLSAVLLFVCFIMFVVPDISIVKEPVVVGAHRGNSVDFMENTLPAIEDALKNDDYKFIEFDVQYTKDKQIILHHDLSLVKGQKKIRFIEELTYEELLNVSDYYIPLYSEVMDLVNGSKPVNIEIKSQGNFTEDVEIADFIVGDTIERGIFNDTLFSSVSSDVVKYFSCEYSSAKTGIIYYTTSSSFVNSDGFILDMVEHAHEVGADYLMLNAINLRSYDDLERLVPDDLGIAIWYFTDKMYLLSPDSSSSFVFGEKKFVEYDETRCSEFLGQVL